MRYTYKDTRTQKLFENDNDFARKYGHPACKRRDRRLSEIASYDNLAELLRLGQNGPGRWHVLDNRDGGKDTGKISGDLTGRYRILLSATNDPYGEVVEVEICEIKDTHKRKKG